MVQEPIGAGSFRPCGSSAKLRLWKVTMFGRGHMVGLALALLSVTAIPASAQVEKVETHTVVSLWCLRGHFRSLSAAIGWDCQAIHQQIGRKSGRVL